MRERNVASLAAQLPLSASAMPLLRMQTNQEKKKPVSCRVAMAVAVINAVIVFFFSRPPKEERKEEERASLSLKLLYLPRA